MDMMQSRRIWNIDVSHIGYLVAQNDVQKYSSIIYNALNDLLKNFVERYYNTRQLGESVPTSSFFFQNWERIAIWISHNKESKYTCIFLPVILLATLEET